jgi:hypothetical protein
MTGTVDLWPVMADCERGLGRPERALEMAGAPEVHKLDKAGQVEMRLVAAGARQDMGQAEAAVVTLQSSELASSAVHPWTARLRYAYADALLVVGREGEARDWFAKALEADHNGTTDASDRLAQLDGVAFVDAIEDDENDAAKDSHTAGNAGDRQQAGHDDASDEDEDDASDESDDDFDDDEDADDADSEDDEDDEDDDAPAGAPARQEEKAAAADASDAERAVGTEDDLTDEADPSSFLDSPFRAPSHPEREED